MTLVSFLCRNILYCVFYIHFLCVVVIIHVLVIVKDLLYNDVKRRHVLVTFVVLVNLDLVINLLTFWPSASLARYMLTTICLSVLKALGWNAQGHSVGIVSHTGDYSHIQ